MLVCRLEENETQVGFVLIGKEQRNCLRSVQDTRQEVSM